MDFWFRTQFFKLSKYNDTLVDVTNNEFFKVVIRFEITICVEKATHQNTTAITN